MKFDMHCHTQEGSTDSKVSIEEYMQLLIQKGFDGMLVTDHDSYRAYKYYQKHLKHKYPNFVVLKGVEYDTVDAGHFLVVMPQGVHLKVLEIKGMTLRFLIHLVHKHGGILGPAHPCGGAFLSIYSTGVYRYKKNISKKFDFLEGYNACEKLEINQAAARIARKYGKPIFG